MGVLLLHQGVGQAIERTRGAGCCRLEHVGVDHGRADIRVTQQLLDCSNVGAGLEQVRGERMAQGVHGRRLGDAGGLDGGSQIALQAFLMQVVTALHLAVTRIGGYRWRREYPEPGPAFGCTRVFRRQGMWKMHTGTATGAIAEPNLLRCIELLTQWFLQRARQHHHTVFAALSIADDDDLTHEVDILDPKSNPLEKPHSRAVQQPAQQAGDAFHPRQHRLDFPLREHNRQALLWHGATQLAQPRHVDAQDFPVQKQQGTEGLTMRRSRNTTLVGQHHQEALDMLHPELARMPHSGPPHKAANPIDVGLFGP